MSAEATTVWREAFATMRRSGADLAGAIRAADAAVEAQGYSPDEVDR